MRKIIGTLGLIIIAITLHAQPADDVKDPKAKAILEELSKKNKSYSSIKAEFSYKLENKDESIDETQNGSLLLMGNKYIVNMVGQEIYFDEKYVWRWMPDEKEVTKDCAPDPEEEADNLLNPSNIFTIYEKGFKFSYKKEDIVNGRKAHVIYLYPENADDKPYHTIILNIDVEKMEIISMEVRGKDGNIYTTTLTKFTANVPVNDADFTFDESKADDVIDLCD
ncbi:MAG: outer membrane lipoprotein carrier protein LolA [Flavobacteriales bacterium]|nr:outer membrane lipoprotein carrier protein LolA [Flavobacteriales bacterium]